MPFLSNHVLFVESSILNITEASEACTSLDVGLGSFVMSGMRHQSTLEVFLVRWEVSPLFCVLAFCG